jgi:hypothetical protein
VGRIQMYALRSRIHHEVQSLPSIWSTENRQISHGRNDFFTRLHHHRSHGDMAICPAITQARAIFSPHFAASVPWDEPRLMRRPSGIFEIIKHSSAPKNLQPTFFAHTHFISIRRRIVDRSSVTLTRSSVVFLSI